MKKELQRQIARLEAKPEARGSKVLQGLKDQLSRIERGVEGRSAESLYVTRSVKRPEKAED